ncbi:hypothetical protein D3C75_861680 [compost metagenome]
MQRHQVEPGNGFSHGMFHLQAGVHFHEEKLAAIIKQKLDRAGTHIAYGFSSLDGSFTHRLTQLRRKPWCRGFFNDLLVATLD